jgi:hypothetical protein
MASKNPYLLRTLTASTQNTSEAVPFACSLQPTKPYISTALARITQATSVLGYYGLFRYDRLVFELCANSHSRRNSNLLRLTRALCKDIIEGIKMRRWLPNLSRRLSYYGRSYI